jgi:hypothetical protein
MKPLAGGTILTSEKLSVALITAGGGFSAVIRWTAIISKNHHRRGFFFGIQQNSRIELFVRIDTFCVFIFNYILKRKTLENFVLNALLVEVPSLLSVCSVDANAKLVSSMETRSRTTKLIVKNVEMLESSKFDKFDKVSQWLDKLDTFEFHQHQKNPHIAAAANPQNTSSRVSQDKNDDFFDSDSSVNTGMAQ